MIKIAGLHGLPQITGPCNLPQLLVATIKKENMAVAEGDILCVASKICSLAEGNVIALNHVTPSPLA